MENLTEKEMKLIENVWYADFETTTETNFKQEDEVRVYMWGLMSADGEEYYTGDSILSFLRTIQDRVAPLEGDKKSIWFHNLKFDFSFIESHFLRTGAAQYKHMKRRYAVNSFGREYITTRDDMGNLYSSMWFLGDKRTVSFKDSAKVYPTTIKALGPSVGLEKLDEQFDYTQTIPRFYNPSETDLEYLYNDIEIIRRAMNRQIIEGGGEKLTRTGYAFDGLKNTYIREHQPDDWNPKDHGLEKGQTIFDLHFPATSPEEYMLLSRAYSGGIVYVNPKYRSKRLKAGLVYDVNSEYPGAMIKHDFPIGEGAYFEGNYDDLPDRLKKVYPLYVQIFKAKFKLKKGGFPSLPKNYGKNKRTVYSSDDLDKYKAEHLVLTSVDLKHFFKNYEVEEIEYIQGIGWQSVHAPFKTYIDEQAELKINAELSGDMVGRFMYKSNMNGCYGKFAQKPNRASKDSYLDDNEVLRFTERNEEPEAQQYFPMAIFIAAWARNTLLEGIYTAGVERVLYVDTDSIHLLGQEVPKDLPIHDTKLGYWSLDGNFREAKFLRDKTYAEDIMKVNKKTGEIYYEIEYKVAGLNDEAKEQIKGLDDFMLGKAYEGVLTSRLVRGGTLLTEGSKYLTPIVVENPTEEEMKRHEEYMNGGKVNG